LSRKVKLEVAIILVLLKACSYDAYVYTMYVYFLNVSKHIYM